jgi:serine/threonine-protein kinase HipA
MTLDFAEPQHGFNSPCRFGYESDYLVSHYEQIETLYAKAVSARLPLNWEQGVLKPASGADLRSGAHGHG